MTHPFVEQLRFAGLAVATLLLGAGCTPASVLSTPSASVTPDAGSAPGDALLPDASADHTIADTILLSGGELMGDQANLTVLEAVRLAEPDPNGAPQYAFLVEIEGLDAETLPYNLRDFALFDDQGFEYQALNGAQQPEITYGDLAPGRKVKGWLTFPGPSESAYLELEYAPAMALEPAYVRVRLP
jgi:uncharacterized protein DUF4352